MEEKKIQKRHNSLWTVFKSWWHDRNFFRGSSGFTLVELLTVVGIVGILMVGALLTLNPVAQFQKANDARRKSDFSQIQKALETYYQDHSRYPASSSDYKIVVNANSIDWGSSNFSPYMTLLPIDPRPKQRNYVYYSSSDGQKYRLYGSLERSTDLGLCNSGNPCTNLPLGATCGTNSTCNFGVTSPNVSP